jgi:hypothetical protein
MSANDEGMMSYCLELNDDLMKVRCFVQRRLSIDMKLSKNIENQSLLE